MNKRIKRKKAKQYILKHEPTFKEIWNKREDWDDTGYILSKGEQEFMEEVESNMCDAFETMYGYRIDD